MTCAHNERFVSTCDGCLVEMSADRAGLRSENALLKLQNGELRKALEWACRGKRGNRDCYMCAASPGMKHYDDVPCKILNVAGSCQRPAPPCHCSCNPYCGCECHAAKPVDDPCCSRIGCGWVRSEHKLKGGRGCSAFVEKGWGTEKPKSDLVAMMKTHPYTCGRCGDVIRTDVCAPCAFYGAIKKRSQESPKEWHCAKCGKEMQFYDGLCMDCFGGDPGQ